MPWLLFLCFWRKKKRNCYILYVFNIWYRLHTVIFFFCILYYPFNSQLPLKHNSDVKTETNGATLVDKKDKKIKKSQPADSTSSKETRKDRKINRKRVCLF